MVSEAISAGQVDFGENYVQELKEKAGALSGKNIRWHFIGALQRNKVKYLPGLVHLIHSVDSIELAEEIARQFEKRGGYTADVLVEVNVAGERSKAGVSRDKLSDLVTKITQTSHLKLHGLMTMPPIPENPDDTRPYFKSLVEIRNDLEKKIGVELKELSMGMSMDFEQAIEEGATIVRVGTAIFGERR